MRGIAALQSLITFCRGKMAELNDIFRSAESTAGSVESCKVWIEIDVFIFGFAIEVIADNQKSAFRSIPENKDSFINEGLWARSRHPNYFGEITLWAGITVMGISTFEGMNYLAIFSPIFSYLLLVYVSGVRMLENRGHKKWGHLEDYQNYKKNTPKLIPKIF